MIIQYLWETTKPEVGGKLGWEVGKLLKEKKPIHGGHMCHGSHMTEATISVIST